MALNFNKTHLHAVLDRGLDYILRKQSSEGSWLDWNLPPGPSDLWTTAFVGWRLRRLPADIKPRAKKRIDSACEWLLRNVLPDGGWGYNGLVESDADSTALAILFLSSQEYHVPEESYACLRQFQRTDGGFSTFRENGTADSWRISHLEVTPTAVLALAAKYGTHNANVKRGLDFLRCRHKSGAWYPFWWTSFLYGTEAFVTLITALGAAVWMQENWLNLPHLRTHNNFETALLVSILLESKCEPSTLERLANRLSQSQHADGSWSSEGILRITGHDCFEPWKPGDPDSLFADQNRLFTTSTILDALSGVYAAA